MRNGCFRFDVSGYGCDVCLKNLSHPSDEVISAAHKVRALQLLLLLL